MKIELTINEFKSIFSELNKISKNNIEIKIDNNQYQKEMIKLQNWFKNLGYNYSIEELKNLKILYLSNNQLQSIPKEIGNLTNLKELWLHNNYLQSIPEEIGNYE